jgi:hypothetical protein
LRAQGVVDFVDPAALYPSQNVLVWNISNLHLVVVFRVILEYDTFNFVLRLAKPAFFEIMQDDLQLCFRAGNVAHIGHADAKCTYGDLSARVMDSCKQTLTSQEASQMGGRVGKLVLLVVPVLQVDEDTQVVVSGNDFDAGSRELCAQLVVSTRRDSFLGAIDPESGDWRVV